MVQLVLNYSLEVSNILRRDYAWPFGQIIVNMINWFCSITHISITAIFRNVINNWFIWLVDGYWLHTTQGLENHGQFKSKENWTLCPVWNMFSVDLICWASLATEPLLVDSWLLIPKAPEVPTIHLTNLRKMDRWVDFEATQWVWIWD